MQNLQDIFKMPKKQKKKAPTYKFQETCLEIIKLAGFDKQQSSIVWCLWKRKGRLIENVLAEMKAGEVKNPEIYIKHLLKK